MVLQLTDADLNYQPMIEAGDPDYVTLHQKMQKRPEEVYFDSASEGVDKLRNGRCKNMNLFSTLFQRIIFRNVMHCLQSFFLSWQKENPFEPQDFYIFGKERPILSVCSLCSTNFINFFSSQNLFFPHRP